jgi:signal peptidase II
MKQFQSAFRKYLFLFIVFAMGCNADLSTKQWAETRLKDKVAMEVLPRFLDFTYVENPAVAFGMLRELNEQVRMPLIFTLTALATLFILILFWQWRNKKITELLPLALVLAGAAGNITDRINNGYVIDFIYVHYQYQYNFYVFNIADMLVFCGVCWLMYQNWKQPEDFYGSRTAIK